MNSLAIETPARAVSVLCTQDALKVELADGRSLAVPLAWFPRLADAEPEQRARYELMGEGLGIHWPDVDEDISVSGLLSGHSSIEAQRGAA